MRLILLLLAGVLLAGCNLEAETPPPTPDLPRVSITAPQNNRQVFEGVDVSIEVEATDNTVGVSRVELYVDGQLLREADLPTESIHVAQFNWVARGVGRHPIQAIAYRPDGTRSPEQDGLIELEVIPREETAPEATAEATPDS
jgi:hypothetical protein